MGGINNIFYNQQKNKYHMDLPANAHNSVCNRGADHKGMPIVMVCLDNNCSRKRLCCLTCIDELHCKHELISVKKFENYIYNTLNHNMLIKNKQQMLGIIVKTRTSIQQDLQKTRAEYNKKIDQLQFKLKKHFQSIQSTFMQQKIHDINVQLYSQFTDEKIEYFFKLSKKFEENLVNSIQQITKSLSLTQKSLEQKLLSCKKQQQKIHEAIAKIIEQIKITGKSIKNKIEFNGESKAACLLLEDENRVVKRIEGTGGYPIAVVAMPFAAGFDNVSFTVVEQPGNKGIWMGVCVLDIVKNFNYQSCYGIGKGTWAIDQVGQNHASAYSWSHHDTNYNSAPKVGWQFAIGDVINIKVDFQKSIVRFTKNQSMYYEQPIKLDLGPLHAFAGPTNLNDVISIV